MNDAIKSCAKTRSATPASCAPILNATFPDDNATFNATNAQPKSLKALALAVLQRNQKRNQCATRIDETPKSNATFNATFDEKLREKLRTPLDGFGVADTGKPVSVVTCYSCRGTDFWMSIYGVSVCRNCHPPVDGAEVGR